MASRHRSSIDLSRPSAGAGALLLVDVVAVVRVITVGVVVSTASARVR